MGNADEYGENWKAHQHDSNPDRYKAKRSTFHPVITSAKGPAEIQEKAHRERDGGCQHGPSQIRHARGDSKCKGADINTVLERADDGKADELVKMRDSSGWQ